EKYMKYFGKLIKVIEQLLCFLLNLESCHFENNGPNSNCAIFELIQSQLSELVYDEHLLQCNTSSAFDPILDLLKMLTNVSFELNQNGQLYTTHEIEDLVGGDDCRFDHPRTCSLDSLISDNE